MLCATNRKVAGSIPGGVLEIYPLLNPSGQSACNRTEYQGFSLGIKAAGV